MNISQVGINLIKSFEGCRLTAYKDAIAVWTIGFGHTANVRQGDRITQDQADNLLEQDLKKYSDAVNDVVKVPINQYQHDALTSFCYNCGIGNLKNSTLLKKVNVKDFAGAAAEFTKWNKAGGKVLKGLVTRRAAEKALFLKPVEQLKPNPPYTVIVPNTVYWQAAALVKEYEKRKFKCQGVAVKKYGPGQHAAKNDPYKFVIHTDSNHADGLVAELRKKGYSKTQKLKK